MAVRVEVNEYYEDLRVRHCVTALKKFFETIETMTRIEARKDI